jgi:hypothetical protein
VKAFLVVTPLRGKTNFFNRFNLIWVVQSFPKKYLALSAPQITAVAGLPDELTDTRVA